MAVTALSPNAIEFTASGDEFLEVCRVASFLAQSAGTSGAVIVETNTLDTEDPTLEGAQTPKEIWRKTLSANETEESAVDIGWCRGLKVTLPTNGRLVAYIA